MKKRIGLYSLIAGLLFLISSFAKAININGFSNIINQYGFEYIHYLAPLIVLAEALIGLSLIFQIYLKRTALIAVLLLLLFTVVYAYGLMFKGITDCGCFGRLTLLNTSPAVTFLRNALLLYLLIAVWRKGNNTINFNKWIVSIMLIVICLVTFMSGNTFRYSGNLFRKYKIKAVKDTVLKDFITTSKDSTYLVFAFSYTCPHCMNSIENLKQYESSGTVDKIIGIALDNPDAEKQFVKIFKPEFSIKNYPADTFRSLTNTYPKSFYIKNDSIIAILPGELPCSYVFMKMLH